MIILDTNIISELMKHTPSPKVVKWIDQQDSIELYITTITVAEISYGINALPRGNRRQLLEHAFNKLIDIAFKHRILFFDENSAHQYGKLMGHRKRLGKPLSILDGQIAAIACAQSKTLATRNTRDFIECGLELANPFE
jgi:predicted nucleic acid-binding protein